MSKIKEKAAAAVPPTKTTVEEVKPAVAKPDNTQVDKGKGVPGR